jgi:hypothetical protein
MKQAIDESAKKAIGYKKGQAFNEGYTAGAKYQAKRMYSEQDMIDFGNKMQLVSDVDFDGNIKFEFNPSEAIKKFKKK